jgi:PD-(D/E)XK nuclease superfamily protein
MDEREILEAHHVRVRGDNPWQRRARLMQALWRERVRLPIGDHRGSPLGSRITRADGEPPVLSNYLSDPAKRQVLAAIDASARTGALFGRPRLWVDLLSSQPLCFNLFGPLAEDADLATAALRLVWPRQITRVIDVWFEWSPGRGNPRYTGNRSAFDVFIAYEGAAGRGFFGIEVKYHEDLSGNLAPDKDGRLAELAATHRVFRDKALSELQRLPLQQLWLDHLLALQLRASPDDGWDEGTFVLLSPTGNVACTSAANRYRSCLSDSRSFDARTLDEVVQAIRLATGGGWIDAVYDRYLDPTPLRSLEM